MRNRESKMRWFVGFLAVTGALFAVMDCASVPVNTGRLILVSVENARSRDMTDPHFYLLGAGRLSLGVVPDLSSRTILVDSKWLAPDGCLEIEAHYPGLGDWISDRVCWQDGEVIDVRLMPIFSTSSAWSHRPLQ